MSDHEWLYGGIEPDTVCLRCGMTRMRAPLIGGGQQGYAPCPGYATRDYDGPEYAEPLPSRKRPAQLEYAFQTVAIIYLRRVLVKPAEAFAIVNESELTQNGRARAKARGAMPGVADIAATQASRIQFLELKYGYGKPSDAQLEFKRRMNACGIGVAACWSIRHIYDAMELELFSLAENAYRLIPEFEERVLAAVRRAEIRAQKPHARQFGERPTQSRIKRFRHVLPGMNGR